MKRYVVVTWDGISGESYEKETLAEAKKTYEQEKNYYLSRGYRFEYIRIYEQDEDGNEVEEVDIFTYADVPA